MRMVTLRWIGHWAFRCFWTCPHVHSKECSMCTTALFGRLLARTCTWKEQKKLHGNLKTNQKTFWSQKGCLKRRNRLPVTRGVADIRALCRLPRLTAMSGWLNRRRIELEFKIWKIRSLTLARAFWVEGVLFKLGLSENNAFFLLSICFFWLFALTIYCCGYCRVWDIISVNTIKKTTFIHCRVKELS